jgi:hypothetical protein
MGQEQDRMTEQIEKNPDRAVSELEREIGQTRKRLSVYLNELDRRRHEFARTFKTASMVILGVGAAAGIVALYFRIRSSD